MMIDNAGKQTLLVIENTTENFALINKTLQNTYLIEHASDSKKGLKLALSDNPPDLILLDTALPDMDGYEVCRRLKEQPETQNIPVIFIAAESSPAEEEKGLALGAVDYITKPLSPPIVKNRVKTHLAIKDSIETIHHRIYIKQSTANDAIQDIFHGYSSMGAGAGHRHCRDRHPAQAHRRLHQQAARAAPLRHRAMRDPAVRRPAGHAAGAGIHRPDPGRHLQLPDHQISLREAGKEPEEAAGEENKKAVKLSFTAFLFVQVGQSRKVYWLGAFFAGKIPGNII